MKLKMSALDQIKSLTNRAITDVVGLHVSSNGTRVVRMKKSGADPVIIGAAMLPPALVGLSGNEEDARVSPLDLPVKLRGRYAALSVASRQGAVKLLRVPDSFRPDNRDDVMVRLACDQPREQRFATKVLIPAAGKNEARVLASAMPDTRARQLLKLMPTAGTPAARLVEVAELGVINAFHNDPRFRDHEDAYGLIHFDHDFSLVALFNNKILSQIRTFNFGISSVLLRVMKALNVDEPTAEGVLMDGAFDISHLIEDGAREIQAQLVICRDFMERSENCSLENLYVSGPAALTVPLGANRSNQQTMTPWNVLDAYAAQGEDAVPEELIPDSWRLAAAIGSCLGLLLPS